MTLTALQGDVDAASPCGDGVGVQLDRTLIESVHLRGLDCYAGAASGDVSRTASSFGSRAPGDEHTRALASENARYGAADRTSAPIDDGIVALK
jgi:hypothetical protein